MRLIVLLLALSVGAAAQADPNDARDARLIAEVQSVSVHAIDETLPEITFEKWLAKESGPDAKYHWEVNDCGEQPGNPNDSGPVPLCVEVDSDLKDSRQIVIFIADDRPENARKDAAPIWKIFFAQLTTPHEKINLRRLSDLPAALIKTHQPTNNPEIAK